MMKAIKNGVIYIGAIIVAFLIMIFVNFSRKYELEPKEIYKVYLDGKVIGNINDKQELEDYINDEQKDLKEKYKVDKVYIPTGVDIQKCTTYEKDILTAKQVHNIIKEQKPFTVKGYKVTIKSKKEDDEDMVLYVLDKDMFDKSIRVVLQAFVSKDEITNFENNTQPEIKDTGSLIEDIYIDQDIVITRGYISTDEQIFTDEKSLTKYLLFGEIKEEEYYTVQEGDTINSIAFANKLAPEEFLIVNPEFTSVNNLLSPGEQVKIGLINPVIDVVVEKHSVFDQESRYKTVTEYDSNIMAGVQEVKVDGQNGMDRMTSKIKQVNGETTNVVIINQEVLTPSVDKVVKVGTKSIYGGQTLVATGDWAWPTISQYYISSPFAYRWGVLHDAIDIAGSGEGSPIYAANDGTVATASWGHYSLGNHVVINHNNGYYTMYAHLSSINVSVGQTVRKYQQIGAMGHTGQATGTHLHFGVYVNGMPYRGGRPIDPLTLYR